MVVSVIQCFVQFFKIMLIKSVTCNKRGKSSRFRCLLAPSLLDRKKYLLRIIIFHDNTVHIILQWPSTVYNILAFYWTKQFINIICKSSRTGFAVLLWTSQCFINHQSMSIWSIILTSVYIRCSKLIFFC